MARFTARFQISSLPTTVQAGIKKGGKEVLTKTREKFIDELQRMWSAK